MSKNTKMVTPARELPDLNSIAALRDCTYLKVYYKQKKITASLRHNGRTYGARGHTFREVLWGLVEQVE